MATDHPPIGDRIRRARNLRQPRLTQVQLARLIGVDRKTVDNWENDRTYPGQRIPLLEQVLGVSLADPEPAPGPEPDDDDEGPSEEAIRLAHEILEMTRRREERRKQRGGSSANIRRYGT